MALVAAIDVGGTKTRIELFREAAAEEPPLSHVLDTPRTGPVLGDIAKAVLDLADGETLESAAVGCPGPLDPVNGIVLNPPNLSEGWWDLDVPGGLASLLSCPVALENDCNLGALGEAISGAGRDFRSVLYVTVSTGIGAGLVMDGEIFSGSRGFAGELGHTTVTDGAFPCGCGRNGCLEAVASGTAIALQAHHRGFSLSTGVPATARDVAEAASEGDRTAREVLLEAATYSGRALVNFLYAYDPEVVILGGGVSQSQTFFDMVREAVEAEPTMPVFRDVPLRRAEFGERSVVQGARTLAARLARKEFSS